MSEERGPLFLVNMFLNFHPGSHKKSRLKKYNLRSFSRRKAEAQQKDQIKEQPTKKKPIYQVPAASTKPAKLANSFSCPELREGKPTNKTSAMNLEDVSKEPVMTIGVVNLASDTSEADDEDGISRDSGVELERAVSDSEVNYCESWKKNGSSGLFVL